MGAIVSSCINFDEEADRQSLEFLESRGVSDSHLVLSVINRSSALYSRLNRVISGDNLVPVGETFFDDCFKSFCRDAPEWSPEKMKSLSFECNIFWTKRSEEWRQQVLIIRQQTLGYCLLIAVFVFEHYLMAIRGGRPIATTYDVGNYAAATLRGAVLKEFLLNGKLDSTVETLKSLCRFDEDDLDMITLPTDSYGRPDLYEQTCAAILREVANQPAILAQFKAADISSSNKSVFRDLPPSNLPSSPRHAMLLIGARKGHDGEYYFLIQNWWESRYFLELSGRYLAKCCPTVIFVKPSTTLERKESFDKLLNSAVYAETCADISDSCPES